MAFLGYHITPTAMRGTGLKSLFKVGIAKAVEPGQHCRSSCVTARPAASCYKAILTASVLASQRRTWDTTTFSLQGRSNRYR